MSDAPPITDPPHLVAMLFSSQFCWQAVLYEIGSRNCDIDFERGSTGGSPPQALWQLILI